MGSPIASIVGLSGHRVLAALTVRRVLRQLRIPGIMLVPYHSLAFSLVEAPLPLKIKIFVWQLLRDRLPSGTEVLKRQGPGDGLCTLCTVPKNGTRILFSCTAARVLRTFIHEALGPDWVALDLAEFLQTRATQPGRHRRLFWLILRPCRGLFGQLVIK